MLAVTTFSLSTMVSAYSAATSNVTPRATKLIMEDTTTQNVLSTFVGSFLFSLVGIIVLSTGLYGEQGRVVLFAVTILVIVAIVVTLLRWIDHLSRLGRVTETTQRVEAAADGGHARPAREPYIGGRPLPDPDGHPASRRDRSSLARSAMCSTSTRARCRRSPTEGSGRIYVLAIPGDLRRSDQADRLRRRARRARTRRRRSAAASRSATSAPSTRIHASAPSVLTEIASRALSPGINDPGTAIDVIGRAVRLLAIWGEPPERGTARSSYPNVFVPPIDVDDLFDDLFTPIARDGASTVEIGVRLQKAFRTLSRFGRDGYRRERAAAFARRRWSAPRPRSGDRGRQAAPAGVGRGSFGTGLARGPDGVYGQASEPGQVRRATVPASAP